MLNARLPSTVCWGDVVKRWAPITSKSAIPRYGFHVQKQPRGDVHSVEDIVGKRRAPDDVLGRRC